MTRKTIQSFRENDAVQEIYRFTDKQLRPNKNGNLYLQFTLSDKTGGISGRFWNVNEEIYAPLADGDYVYAEGAIQRFQGTLQFIAKKLTRVEPAQINPDDFLQGGVIDISALLHKLREILLSIKSPPLAALAHAFLTDELFCTRFTAAVAGVKIHHAYPGGLLEHTVTMLEAALALLPLYPQLNRDLLLMGVFLHDLGKIEELPSGRDMIYTDAGQLLGHSLLGVEILTPYLIAAEKLLGETFDVSLTLLLKHCIASHHGSHENQAIKLPMFPEAMLIHLLDMIDAKLAEFQRCLIEDPTPDSAWTNFIPAINRKLYRVKIVE